MSRYHKMHFDAPKCVTWPDQGSQISHTQLIAELSASFPTLRLKLCSCMVSSVGRTLDYIMWESGVRALDGAAECTLFLTADLCEKSVSVWQDKELSTGPEILAWGTSSDLLLQNDLISIENVLTNSELCCFLPSCLI